MSESEARGPLQDGGLDDEKQSAEPAPAPDTPPAQGLERGTPSRQLQEASSIVDTGGEYEPITEAAPEKGIFYIVGGYLDDDGVVHNEAHMRAMAGPEEELLGNRSIHILDRLNTIVADCTTRLGTIRDPGQITQAVNRLPMGSKIHLLISMRRVSHWKRHKDNFEMEKVRCPITTCEKLADYAVDLSTVETFEMPEPTKREYEVELLDLGISATWRIATSPQERIFSVVSNQDEKMSLHYAIMVRLVSLGGEDVRLSISDVLTTDKKKIKLSPKATALFQRVRAMTTGDRDDFRADFLNKEPAVDMEIDFDCKHCQKPFKGTLDVTQESFWFPSATSRRSKMKASI